MALGERLKEERVRLGYNQTDFAGLARASKRSQIGWEQGRSNPDGAAYEAWAKIGLDVVYVFTGTRTMVPNLAPDEAALLDNYRHAPKEQQDILKATSAAFAQCCKGSDKEVG